MEVKELEAAISAAFADREKTKDPRTREAVELAIDLLDRGEIRVAEKVDGVWRVNSWVKEAILLYFASRPLEPSERHDLEQRTDVQTRRRRIESDVARDGTAGEELAHALARAVHEAACLEVVQERRPAGGRARYRRRSGHVVSLRIQPAERECGPPQTCISEARSTARPPAR